ncbi:F-box/LRR-repeat protein At4g14103-like [Carex rostrata]
MVNINIHRIEQNYGIDRISSLSDDVCTHILSFLSTRETVQTCILSKRWRKTWASVPNLKFDIEEFGLPDIVDDKMAVEFVTKFELLVTSAMEKQETSCVNKFELSLDSAVYWPCTQAVADCIGDVMKLKPQECTVGVGSCENLNLNTDLIFTCASLTYLFLWFSMKTINLQAIEPNLVNLPCLKSLRLFGVKISDDTFKKLLLGCPMLENLVLAVYDIGTIEICSNTLKMLRIRNAYGGMKLQISTPNLLYLNITVVDMGEIILLNMPSVVDASISIPRWYDHDNYVTRGPKLICTLANVETLRLEFDLPKRKVQKKDFSNCLVFNNLKHLELVNSDFVRFDLASFFLHHSPKLQELTFETKHAWAMDRGLLKEKTQEGLRDALVQREFLKTIRITGLEKDDGFVDRLIKNLLANVKIIGEIIV